MSKSYGTWVNEYAFVVLVKQVYNCPANDTSLGSGMESCRNGVH